MSQDTTFGFDECLKIAAACGLGFVDAQNLYTAISSGGGGTGTQYTLPRWSDTSGGLEDSHVADDDTLVTITKRTRISTAFDGPSDQHGALTVLSSGVSISADDGGVQSFQQSTFDTSGGPSQSIAIYAGNSATVATGAGALTNYAILATAAGGDNNYSFYGLNGLLTNEEDCGLAVVSGGVTIGTGSTAGAGELLIHTDVTIDNTKTVDLGNNVLNFKIPGSGSVTPQINLGGAAAAAGEQFVVKNTVTGSQTSGMSIGLDTTVDSSVRGGLFIWRGAGGGIGGSVEGGIAYSAGSDFISGIAANDIAIFNTASSKKICFSSDGSGFTMGAALDANGTWCAKALQVGAPSGMTGAKWTSGTGSPEGAVTGNKGDLFSRTDGGAATCLYVKESTGGNTGWKAVTTS